MWGLGGERTFASSAKAISRCGVYCNKSVSDVNRIGEYGFLGDNIITVYDQPGYYGMWTNFVNVIYLVKKYLFLKFAK